MKMTFKALALVTALVSAPSFAADYVTDLATAPVDVTAEAVAALTVNYVSLAGAPTDPFTVNVALIQQESAVGGNIAVIDQSLAAVGNFAAITQSILGASLAPAVGYINQGAGSTLNDALIKQ
jgi:hypothetical protein